MKKFGNYESAKLELVYFETSDVIATSTPTFPDNDGSSDGLYDQDGWT